MKTPLLFLLSAVLFVGCGKQEEAAPAVKAKPATSLPSLQIPSEAPPPVAVTTTQPQEPKVPVLNTKVDLEALTKALVAYCKKTQANPVSLDEVVKAGFLPGLPALPPGKKFDIDRDTYKVIVVEAGPTIPQPDIPAPSPARLPSIVVATPSPPQESKVPTVNVKVDLNALTKALVAYCRKTQANPISLDEVVKAGFLPALPALPPGKKFDIDRDTYKVIIVDAPITLPEAPAAPPAQGKAAQPTSPAATTNRP